MSSILTTTATETTDAPPRPFPFLALPHEIRHLIYLELLVCPFSPTDKHSTSKDLIAAYARSHARYRGLSDPSTASLHLPPRYLYPDILATCALINAEASRILYRQNHFSAHPTLLTGMPFFLDEARKLLAPQIVARRAIRRWHLRVRLDCDARYDAARLKAAFDGADELVVCASEAMYRGSGLHNLLLFAEIRGVARPAVTGSVDPRVARWLELVMQCPDGVPVPSLDEWQAAAPVLFGGVLSDRAFGVGLASSYHNPWTHSNR